MTWFGKSTPPPTSGKPLAPNDRPEAAPIPLPKLSEARQAAVEAAIAAGKARSVRHALFLANAGALELPA